jgi:5-methylcytosine-specific restriction enzyme B
MRDRYWWVNQGRTWEQERRGGYIWAPTHDPTGSRKIFWTRVLDVEPGDRLVSYVRGSVVAIGTALTSGRHERRPDELPDLWTGQGYRADVRYEELTRPLPRERIPRIWRDGRKEDPFRVTGEVKIGYLFPISASFFEELTALFAEDEDR